jgi:hypothetical protein
MTLYCCASLFIDLEYFIEEKELREEMNFEHHYLLNDPNDFNRSIFEPVKR